jgi:hypothetical protein
VKNLSLSTLWITPRKNMVKSTAYKNSKTEILKNPLKPFSWLSFRNVRNP